METWTAEISPFVRLFLTNFQVHLDKYELLLLESSTNTKPLGMTTSVKRAIAAIFIFSLSCHKLCPII